MLHKVSTTKLYITQPSFHFRDSVLLGCSGKAELDSLAPPLKSWDLRSILPDLPYFNLHMLGKFSSIELHLQPLPHLQFGFKNSLSFIDLNILIKRKSLTKWCD